MDYNYQILSESVDLVEGRVLDRAIKRLSIKNSNAMKNDRLARAKLSKYLPKGSEERNLIAKRLKNNWKQEPDKYQKKTLTALTAKGKDERRRLNDNRMSDALDIWF